MGETGFMLSLLVAFAAGCLVGVLAALGAVSGVSAKLAELAELASRPDDVVRLTDRGRELLAGVDAERDDAIEREIERDFRLAGGYGPQGSTMRAPVFAGSRAAANDPQSPPEGSGGPSGAGCSFCARVRRMLRFSRT